MYKSIVSPELARLAQDKGFNFIKFSEPHYAYTNDDKQLILSINGNVVTGYILAPTNEQLQVWLWEKFKVLVYPYQIPGTTTLNYIVQWKKTDFWPTLEEALTFALLIV